MKNKSIVMVTALLSSLTLAAQNVTENLTNQSIDEKSYPRSRHLEGRTEREKVHFGFEDLNGWKISYPDDKIKASFTRSREEPLWGNYVGRLELQQAEIKPKAKDRVILIPPDNFIINEDFDAINIWTFGTAFATPPRLSLMLHFQIEDVNGKHHEFSMQSQYQGWLFWDGWSIWHKALPITVKAPAKLTGIVIDGVNHARILAYFDSLSFYRQSQAPLPDAKAASWQELGIPNRPETILPDATTPSKSTLSQLDGKKWQFRGGDLTIDIVPVSGALNDIRVTYQGKTFEPMANGGFYWADGKKLLSPADPSVKGRLKNAQQTGNKLILDWIYQVKGRQEPACWILELKNNSLIIELSTTNGSVAEVKCGGIKGLSGKVVEIPYMNLRSPRKNNEGPGVFCGENIYISTLLDWYNSDASELFSECSSKSGGVWRYVPSEGDTRWFPDTDSATQNDSSEVLLVNGGSEYGLKTDGTRNPVKERLFLSIDNRFAAVLPNIPNPPHKYLNETAEIMWATRMFYENNEPRDDMFDRELEMWKTMYAYGAKNLNIRYHGDLFRIYKPRRNGDPITFIDDIEPAIGGDAGLKRLFDGLKKMGYRVGLYTGHTLLSPLSYDVWDEDYLTLNKDKDWVYGSGSHLQVKTTRMRNLQKKYNQIFKEKFAPTCSYLDQLTCPPPWRYTDYDARTPEAGKFSVAYRNFVESLRTEMDDFGPVLSEGMSQWLFAGICDNYAQPIRARIHVLPDFQLRKLHMLSNDCGYHLSIMRNRGLQISPKDLVYTGLAYTYAYGNTGHLYGCYSGSPYKKIPDFMIRSYFLIQPIQKFFTLTPIKEILYNVNGELKPIEAAVKAGTLNQNQVKLIYENNAESAANLNETKNFAVRLHDREFLLPPDGFAFYLPGKALAYSALINGKRVDHMQTDDLFYCDNLGILQTTGILIAAEAYIIRTEGNTLKVIPVPFRREETIKIDLGNYAFPASSQKLRISMLDRDGKVLNEKTVPNENILPLRITKNIFAWRLEKI